MGRVYKAEFKQEAIRLALSSGLSRDHIAQDLGCVDKKFDPDFYGGEIKETHE